MDGSDRYGGLFGGCLVLQVWLPNVGLARIGVVANTPDQRGGDDGSLVISHIADAAYPSRNARFLFS